MNELTELRMKMVELVINAARAEDEGQPILAAAMHAEAASLGIKALNVAADIIQDDDIKAYKEREL